MCGLYRLTNYFVYSSSQYVKTSMANISFIILFLLIYFIFIVFAYYFVTNKIHKRVEWIYFLIVSVWMIIDDNLFSSVDSISKISNIISSIIDDVLLFGLAILLVYYLLPKLSYQKIIETKNNKITIIISVLFPLLFSVCLVGFHFLWVSAFNKSMSGDDSMFLVTDIILSLKSVWFILLYVVATIICLIEIKNNMRSIIPLLLYFLFPIMLILIANEVHLASYNQPFLLFRTASTYILLFDFVGCFFSTYFLLQIKNAK